MRPRGQITAWRDRIGAAAISIPPPDQGFARVLSGNGLGDACPFHVYRVATDVRFFVAQIDTVR
jgi:hypothetical protein